MIVGWFFVAVEVSFRVSNIGVWSEERSEELVIVYFMWPGSVVIKKSRTSGRLLACEGQYVG